MTLERFVFAPFYSTKTFQYVWIFLFQASYQSNRGNVYLKLKRFKDAEDDISASIALAPNNAKVITYFKKDFPFL